VSVAGPIPPRSLPTRTVRAREFDARVREMDGARVDVARGPRLLRVLSLALLGLSIVTIAALAGWQRGDKLFYIHVPAAIDTFVACGAVCIAGMAYLWTRRAMWDRLAAASAGVAVAFCTAVLISGMLWAQEAWGLWWVWSPRLTFSLVLWLLYIGYFCARAPAGRRRGVVCAVYGLIAFLDVPLVWLSVKLLPDIHPETVQSRGEVGLILLAWLGALTALGTGIVGVVITRRSTRTAE
jgi:heme exporter protein C